jgi:hypothetical protein
LRVHEHVWGNHIMERTEMFAVSFSFVHSHNITTNGNVINKCVSAEKFIETDFF